jgi:hypothetical protein
VFNNLNNDVASLLLLNSVNHAAVIGCNDAGEVRLTAAMMPDFASISKIVARFF